MCRLAIVSLISILFLNFPQFAAAQTVVEVSESNADWGFVVEGGAPVFGLDDGPGTPPQGSGSAFMQLAAGADSVLFGTALHNGLRLADITLLTYATYQDVTPQAIALQFNVDYDDTDADVSWQSRLVYEPYYTHPVVTDTWQTWDTLDDSGNGNWWSSGTPVVGGVQQPPVCTMNDPCTWSEVLVAYPDIAIHSTLGALFVKAGSGWPAFNGAADAVRIATAGFDVLYDFETEIPVELVSFVIE